MRAGVVPTTPGLSKESGERRVIFWLSLTFVVLCRPGNFLFVFSLRCVGFSRSSVLKFPLEEDFFIMNGTVLSFLKNNRRDM